MRLIRTTLTITDTSVRDIVRRNQEALHSIPQHLRYYPEVWSEGRDREQCFSIAVNEMDFGYNEFLIQRTLVKRGRASSKELIRVSRQMLSTLLDIINHRAQIGIRAGEIPWLVLLSY